MKTDLIAGTLEKFKRVYGFNHWDSKEVQEGLRIQIDSSDYSEQLTEVPNLIQGEEYEFRKFGQKEGKKSGPFHLEDAENGKTVANPTE